MGAIICESVIQDCGQSERKYTCAAPASCSCVSFSCCSNLASSSKLKANGKATSRAEVVTIQTTFPTHFVPVFTAAAVFETLCENLCRVCGGTMSTSAAIRSNTVSSASNSEETDDSEVVEDAAELRA